MTGHRGIAARQGLHFAARKCAGWVTRIISGGAPTFVSTTTCDPFHSCSRGGDVLRRASPVQPSMWSIRPWIPAASLAQAWRARRRQPQWTHRLRWMQRLLPLLLRWSHRVGWRMRPPPPHPMPLRHLLPNVAASSSAAANVGSRPLVALCPHHRAALTLLQPHLLVSLMECDRRLAGIALVPWGGLRRTSDERGDLDDPLSAGGLRGQDDAV